MKREKQAGCILPCAASLAARTDACQVWASFAQISFKSVDGDAAQRNDPLLVPFAAHVNTPGIEREVAGRKRCDFRNPQASRVQQLKDCPVAQCSRMCLGMRGSHSGALKHFGNFRFGQ